MKTWKKALVLAIACAFALGGSFSSLAFAGVGISPMDIVPSSTLLQMRSYLTTQYNNSTSNSSISRNAGYLFALKAIAYAIAGTDYETIDCSELTYYSLKEAYTSKTLQDYYIFGNKKITSREQYLICANNNLILAGSENEPYFSGRQTGDLIFWTDSTGSIGHVGIYFRYNNGDYVIESRTSENGVIVTDHVWEGNGYKVKCYARINKALTATFRVGAPFTGSLGTQKVLYNCPPAPPSPPTHSGYTFTGWSPSITAGMRSNTTYTANYIDNSLIMSVPDNNG